MRKLLLAVVLSGSTLLASRASGAAEKAPLGELDFPVTVQVPAARQHFLRGVLALHSFFYDEAVDAFRTATRLDPGFQMGYWGEAMSLNQTIWEWQDLEGGRKALAQLSGVEKLPAKEQALIGAVRLLYGEGNRLARATAYATQMGHLHAQWPDDPEITSFTALALLGTIAPDDAAVATRMRAGALALQVLGQHPRHPGAAHYVIHSFDDPTHAILALPAARLYAQIAPDAFHARHMPAHIFVQLGMWQEAVDSCRSAWAASQDWLGRRQLPQAKADYHSLNWLVSLYLVQGRRSQAEATLRTFADLIATDNATSMRSGYLAALLPLLRDTQAWERSEQLLAPLGRPVTLSPEQRAIACHPTAGNPPAGFTEQFNILSVRAHAAAARGDEPALRRLRAEQTTVSAKLGALPLAKYIAGQLRIQDASTQGLLALSQHRYGAAGQQFLQAAKLDDELSGNWYADPGLVPWDEEAGRAFLLANQPAAAAQAFAAALTKRPGRTRALLGAAKAAELTGQRGVASDSYTQALFNLRSADPDSADLTAARAGLTAGPRASATVTPSHPPSP